MKKILIAMGICLSMVSFSTENTQPGTNEIASTTSSKKDELLKKIEGLKKDSNNGSENKLYLGDELISKLKQEVESKQSSSEELTKYEVKLNKLIKLIDELNNIVENNETYKSTNGYSNWEESTKSRLDSVYNYIVTHIKGIKVGSGIDSTLDLFSKVKNRYYAVVIKDAAIKEINKLENIKDEEKKSIVGKINKDTVNDEEEINGYVIEYKKINAKKDSDYIYLNDVSIIDQIDKGVFVKVGTGGNILNEELTKSKIFEMIGEVSLGISKDIENVRGLKLGGFVEYKYQTSHNVSFGIMSKYKELSSFARYRMSILLKDDFTVMNHNIDLYARYSKDIQIASNYGLIPNVGVNVICSSETDLNKEKTELLKDRLGITFDLGTKFYYTNKSIKLYIYPEIKAGYNDQKIVVKYKNKEEEMKVNRNYFNYLLELGMEKSFDKVRLGGNLNISGSYTSDIKLGASLETSYNW